MEVEQCLRKLTEHFKNEGFVVIGEIRMDAGPDERVFRTYLHMAEDYSKLVIIRKPVRESLKD